MDLTQILTYVAPPIVSMFAFYTMLKGDMRAYRDDLNKIDANHREDMKEIREDMKKVDEKWERMDQKWERLFERLLLQDKQSKP
jgi:hypothetical protein